MTTHREGQTAPILGGAISVTPHNTTTYFPALRGLYVGVSGNVAVVFKDDTSVIYTNLVAGVIHPITNIKSILATGTTATGIIAHQG